MSETESCFFPSFVKWKLKELCCAILLKVHLHIYMFVILFVALPSHGGVPGGGGSQREAAAGGDSPRPGRGHAEWPAPSGPGELPGCPAGRPPEGKHHTPASESIFYPHLSPSVCFSLPAVDVQTHSHTILWNHTEPCTTYVLWLISYSVKRPSANKQFIMRRMDYCSQKNTHPKILYELQVNHIWTYSYNSCVVFFKFLLSNRLLILLPAHSLALTVTRCWLSNNQWWACNPKKTELNISILYSFQM